MNLHHACINILEQLRSFVEQIHPQDYYKPLPVLNQSSPGQHLRHTLEFFLCLKKGYESGTVNYDKRNHDRLIETDRSVAQHTLGLIREFAGKNLPDKSLKLEVSYSQTEGIYHILETTFQRELAYNIEHAVHHMAIIKIGVRDSMPYISLPDNFGIAASTVRHKETSQTGHN